MDFTIYTAGSAEYLQIMLNAVAMITGSGSMEDLARVGAVLGVLLLAFIAAFNNQAISFQKAGLVLVLYMMFYGPTATTVIEDTVSGQVRIVDNVPVGPAFVGSIISTVSYEITQVAEQAFSTPGMTSYGLFSPLTTLTKVRDALRNPLGLDQFVNYGAASGASLPKTLNEYLAFCTLNPAALRNEKSIDDLYRASGVESLLSNASTSQFVYVYDGSAGYGVPALKSCAEAKAWVTTALNAVYLDLMDGLLSKGFAEEKASGKITVPAELNNRIDESIQSFAISSKNAQGYVAASLIAPLFNDARVQALEHWQEKRAALALRDSLNQQNIQWAGKGETFKHYMRPMIAFFEGLLYAMTPFMAFALLLGGPGLSILGKYLILPLAVGMWMPLLSIVNAFTLWYAGAEMEGILNAYDPTSEGFAMLQVMDMDLAISKALGIGGLLAASVPPLALFLVSGSAMVANSIMSQATAGDKFKSEDVNPRAQNSAPVLESNASFTADQLTRGAAVTGARAAGPQISASQAADAAVASSRAFAEQTSDQLQQSLQSSTSQLASTTAGRQTMASLGDQVASSMNLSQNASYNEAKQRLSSLGYTENQIAAGTFAVAGGLSAPMGIAGTRLEESEQFQKMTAEQQQEAKSAMAQLQESVASSKTDATTFATADAFMSSSAATSQAGNTNSLASALTAARTAQQQYSMVEGQKEGWAARQDLDLGTAAAMSIRNSGQTREEAARGMLDMAGRTASEREAIRGLMATETIQSISSDNAERQVAASTLYMMQSGRIGELVSSQYSPYDFAVDAGNANSASNLQGIGSDHAGMRGNLEAEYAAARGTASGAYGSELDMSTSGQSELRSYGADVINDQHDLNNSTVGNGNAFNDARLDGASSPMPAGPDLAHKTTKPVSEAASNVKEDPFGAWKSGAKRIINSVSDL